MSVDHLLALLGGAFVMAVLWPMRARARQKSAVRVRRLNQSADLYAAHAKQLDILLQSPAVPDDLKRTLITVSDALNKVEFVRGFAVHLLHAGPGVASEEEHQDFLARIETLRAVAPDLFECFFHATVSGMFGALLRWDETANLFEEVSARLAASPKREVDIVVTASRMGDMPRPFATSGLSNATA